MTSIFDPTEDYNLLWQIDSSRSTVIAANTLGTTSVSSNITFSISGVYELLITSGVTVSPNVPHLLQIVDSGNTVTYLYAACDTASWAIRRFNISAPSPFAIKLINSAGPGTFSFFVTKRD